ncbi:MAG: hypothetical protein RBS07_10900 [Lentimicrobium sp.]|jgi:hypothetical protein|nr:hypothetical protein [Lentimicrobium sp.]
MKPKSICLLLAAIFFSGCNTNPDSSSGKDYTKNEFLGEVPSINKKYKQKIDEKIFEIKECTDPDKSLKLRKEFEQLKAERDELIEKSFAECLLKPVPFEPIENVPYTISGIKISKASNVWLNVIFSVKTTEAVTEYAKKEIISYLYAYYNLIDKDGNVIANKKYVARNEFDQLKPDMEIELVDKWLISDLDDMGDFVKIRLITKEEYEDK